MTDHVPPASAGPDNDLGKLIDGYFAGMLSPEGLANLDQRLQSDRAARQMYRDQAQLHAFLTWRVRGVTESDVQQRTATLVRMPGQRGVAQARLGARRWLGRPAVVAAAGLMVVAIVGSALLWLRSPVVAHVARSYGTQWIGRSSLTEGTALRAGEQLCLGAGVVEIQFADGAEVFLQGPATFRLEGRNKGRLDNGQLAASVPEQARGFSIDTPTTTVVDYGTEFGVIVKADALSSRASSPKPAVSSSTEVHVFQGEVEVGTPAEQKTNQVAKLTEGKAVEVNQSHQAKALAAAQPAHFTRAVAAAGPIKLDLGVSGNVQEGWIGMDTVNRTPPPLTIASPYAANGSTLTVTLGIDGAPREYASRYRGKISHPLARLLEDFHMHRGTKPFTITFSNLAAGTYRLTSYHHDLYQFKDAREPSGTQPPARLTAAVKGAASADVSRATNFLATQGKNPDPPGTGLVTFVADGTHDVTVSYAVVERSGAPHNGFVLETVKAKP